MESIEISAMLMLARDGSLRAREELLKAVYGRLQTIARNRLRTSIGTLRPTELVHEAYLKALGAGRDFENRRHFFVVAARAMQDILVDSARRKATEKRKADHEPLTDDLAMAVDAPSEDMLGLHAALTELEAVSIRAHQVVMLRFFAGLTSAEVADLSGISESTAERDWQFARTFLHAALVRR